MLYMMRHLGMKMMDRNSRQSVFHLHRIYLQLLLLFLQDSLQLLGYLDRSTFYRCILLPSLDFFLLDEMIQVHLNQYLKMLLCMDSSMHEAPSLFCVLPVLQMLKDHILDPSPVYQLNT